MVLVTGHSGVITSHDDLIGISVGHGEVSELDLRYNYEPQQDSTESPRDARP